MEGGCVFSIGYFADAGFRGNVKVPGTISVYLTKNLTANHTNHAN
jgi:hypothetical protein